MSSKELICIRIKRLIITLISIALAFNLNGITVFAKRYDADTSSFFNLPNVSNRIFVPGDQIIWNATDATITIYDGNTVLDTEAIYDSGTPTGCIYYNKQYYRVDHISNSGTAYKLFLSRIYYTVKYDNNGGTGTIASTTKNDGSDIIVTSESPVREGYTHIGWSTDINAKEADENYKANAEITPLKIIPVPPPNSNPVLTLYAVWQKNPDPTPDTPDQTLEEQFTENQITFDIVDQQEKEVVYRAPENKKAKNLKVPEQVVHNGITYTVTEIAPNAFKGCKNATNINIPNSVKKIGSNAASGLPKLRSVTIGTGTEVIDKKAFNKCPNLTVINIKSKKLKKVGPGALKNTKVGIKIKVPKKTSIKKLLQYKKIFKNSGAKMLKIYK